MHKLVVIAIGLVVLTFTACTKEDTETVTIEPQPVALKGVSYNFVNSQLANHTIVLESNNSADITLLFCNDDKVLYNAKVSGVFQLHEVVSSTLDINLTAAPHNISLHDAYNGKPSDSNFNTGEVIGVVVDSGSLDGYKVKSVYTAPRAVCK